MKKEKYIQKYGKAAYRKMLQQNRGRCVQWGKSNPDKLKAHTQEQCRKGGKHYEHKVKYQTTGLQGERYRVRKKHGRQYRPFKQIIAPESQIHHEWKKGTAEYTGVALVEADQHMHGFVDVIKILEGEITLLMEGLENG